MHTVYRKARLYVTHALAKGQRYALDAPHAHYLLHVLRCKAGEPIGMFNGKDGEWLATACTVSKKSITVQLERQLCAQPAPVFLALAFAPIKRGHLEYMIEKATELGVSDLYPVLTERTVVSRINLQRLQAHCVEAAQQCERLDVPRVHAPQSFDAVLSLADTMTTGLEAASQEVGAHTPVTPATPVASAAPVMLYGDESGSSLPMLQALQSLTHAPAMLLVGPEGGFSHQEHHALQEHPRAQGIGLGPRVMRADTAAIAALSVLQAHSGDWQHPPRGVYDARNDYDAA